MSQFPMADVHVHLNGMMSDAMTVQLADKNQIPLPTVHIDKNGKRLIAADFGEFHKVYDDCVKLIKNPEDLKLVAKTYLTDIAREGAVSADVLSANMNNYRSGGDPWPIFRDNTLAALDAMQEAKLETGIESALAITLKRHLKGGLDAANELIGLAIKFKSKGYDRYNRLNAFHIAGDETQASIAMFRPAFQRMVDAGFRGNAAHVGEKSASSQDVEDGMELPGVHKVAHALSASSNPWLMKKMSERGTMIEVCLTINELLQGYTAATHPLPTFIHYGIPVGLGSDNPMVGITIKNEYDRARKEFGLTDADLLTMTATGIRHGFAPIERRRFAMAKVEQYNKDHEVGLPAAVFNPQREAIYDSTVLDNLLKMSTSRPITPAARPSVSPRAYSFP